MKAFLILADGTVYEGESIGSTREVISEIVFNTSMTGYLEILYKYAFSSFANITTTLILPLLSFFVNNFQKSLIFNIFRH